MAEQENERSSVNGLRRKLSTFFVRALGIRSKRKVALFLDLSRAATLKDLVYWLQIFFSAGIATLGLVLNSPAVIIGAMLISPLMNPILAAGLALASGNLVLGLRAIFNLVLSCAAAIGFAVLLVIVLPFREMTAEIATRTQPNFLDLLIALFSGGVGSVAICREVKGVVTSIPGVAIAVALMPPLCVVGYGIGLSLVFDQATGWRVASGGGLLFLTNLVAITLTAMLVFIALRIDTPYVRKEVEIWEQTDAESYFVIHSMRRFPGLEKARKIHSLSLRFLMILLPLAVIMYPLGSAFSQLQNQISQKQKESRLRQVITDVWQQRFQKTSDGSVRSSIDQLTVFEKDNKININLRVFDDKPYSLTEKKEYASLIAERLKLPPESISLQLTEIPTVSVLDAMNRPREDQTSLSPVPTINEIQEKLLERTEIALRDVDLPFPARILRKQVITGAATPLEIKIVYLNDERISPEAQTQLLDTVRRSLDYDRATISLERVSANIGDISFPGNQSTLPILGMMNLDFAGRIMRENPILSLSAAIQYKKDEKVEIVAQRSQAIIDYMETRWQIAPDRIKTTDVIPTDNKTLLSFRVDEPATETNSAAAK